MNNELRNRAKVFGGYVSAEVKGAIVTHGYSQNEVADAIGRQRANVSRWLNGHPTIPMEVALEICDYIGADLQEVVAAANRRLEKELGPWPPIEVNEDAVAEINSRKSVPEFHMAAKRSKRKRSGGGVDAEFAD